MSDSADHIVTDHLTAAWRHLLTIKRAAETGQPASLPSMLYARTAAAAFLAEALSRVQGGDAVIEEMDRLLTSVQGMEDWLGRQLVARRVAFEQLPPYRHPLDLPVVSAEQFQADFQRRHPQQAAPEEADA